MSTHKTATNKITILALFATLSLVIYSAESLLPPPIPVPGVKLGLANIITLVVLSAYSHRSAFLVLFVRILLSALLFGQAMSLMYSIVGGLCCFLIMWGLHSLLKGRSLFLVSAFGAIAHNLGQLLVAYLLTSVPGVLVYLPFLLLSGTVTGIFTGLCAGFTLRKLMPQATHLPSFQAGDDDSLR